MRYRTDPALIRAVLLDAERVGVKVAAERAKMSPSRVSEWRRIARDAPALWPSDEDIWQWRADRERRERDREYRKTRLIHGALTIDATGARRRIQALYALGWTFDELGECMGGGKNRAHRIAHGTHCTDRGIYAVTHRRVVALYDELSSKRPEGWIAERTRANAARLGWLVPAMWDDIDRDPEPTTSGRSEHNYTAAELVAEWDHLRRAGESIDQAARQLGVTVGAIEKALERVGKAVA